MASQVDGAAVRLVNGGYYITKGSGATAASTTSLFTVTGLVIIERIVGEVTTDYDGTVTSIQLVHNPTIGSVADLCAATVVTSDAIGTLYGYLGVAITTLLVSSGTTAPGTVYAPSPTVNQVLAPGTIGMEGSAADVGETLWHLQYTPLSAGSSVVAA